MGDKARGQTCYLQQGPATAMEVDCWGRRHWEQGHGALTRQLGRRQGMATGGARLGRLGGGGDKEMKMNGFPPPPPFYKSVGQLKSPEAQEPL